MNLNDCINKVRELQKYKGEKTKDGYTVKAVIIGPVDDSRIADFVKVHFISDNVAITKLLLTVSEFEPWVLTGIWPIVLRQKFSEAFPHVEI
jgi:hypothetical protein